MDFEDFNNFDNNLTVDDMLRTFIIVFGVAVLMWLVGYATDYVEKNSVNMYEIEELHSSDDGGSNDGGSNDGVSLDNVNYNVVESLMKYCSHIEDKLWRIW